MGRLSPLEPASVGRAPDNDRERLLTTAEQGAGMGYRRLAGRVKSQIEGSAVRGPRSMAVSKLPQPLEAGRTADEEFHGRPPFVVGAVQLSKCNSPDCRFRTVRAPS